MYTIVVIEHWYAWNLRLLSQLLAFQGHTISIGKGIVQNPAPSSHLMDKNIHQITTLPSMYSRFSLIDWLLASNSKLFQSYMWRKVRNYDWSQWFLSNFQNYPIKQYGLVWGTLFVFFPFRYEQKPISQITCLSDGMLEWWPVLQSSLRNGHRLVKESRWRFVWFPGMFFDNIAEINSQKLHTIVITCTCLVF